MTLSSQLPVKVVLIGDEAVGKTAIFKRLWDNTFNIDQQATIGGSYFRLTVQDSHSSDTEVGMWDTAGSERYRSIVPMYFRGAQIIVCVFDLTSTESFNHITDWIELARNKGPANAQFLLVGNKTDLDAAREINFTEAQQLSEQIGAKYYIETSALNGTGIDLFKTKLGTLIAADSDDWDIVDLLQPQFQPEANKPSGCLARC
jgi:small GTP-binding protein